MGRKTHNGPCLINRWILCWEVVSLWTGGGLDGTMSPFIKLDSPTPLLFPLFSSPEHRRSYLCVWFPSPHKLLGCIFSVNFATPLCDTAASSSSLAFWEASVHFRSVNNGCLCIYIFYCGETWGCSKKESSLFLRSSDKREKNVCTHCSSLQDQFMWIWLTAVFFYFNYYINTCVFCCIFFRFPS